MGEDIEALAKEWCSRKKIFFVHFRNIDGSREHFRETFHDNGPTDMARMLRVYHQCGFAGPVRPDHGRRSQRQSRVCDAGQSFRRRLQERDDESARHPLRISRSAVRRDAAYRLVF